MCGSCNFSQAQILCICANYGLVPLETIQANFEMYFDSQSTGFSHWVQYVAIQKPNTFFFWGGGGGVGGDTAIGGGGRGTTLKLLFISRAAAAVITSWCGYAALHWNNVSQLQWFHESGCSCCCLLRFFPLSSCVVFFYLKNMLTTLKKQDGKWAWGREREKKVSPCLTGWSSLLVS